MKKEKINSFLQKIKSLTTKKQVKKVEVKKVFLTC